MIKQKQFRLSAVAAALAVVFGPALADEVAELIEPESTISIGAGNWSKDRPQTGMYDGMQDGKTYLLIDADINKRDNATGTWYKLDARNLGLDTRSLKGEILRQGNWGIGLEYNEMRRNDPYTYSTTLQGFGTPAISTSPAGTPFHDERLSIRREQWGFSGYKNLMPGFDFNLSYRDENKSGTRFWTTSTNHVRPEMLDAKTQQMEAALSWTTPQYQLRGGYNASWYTNRVPGQVITYATNATNASANNFSLAPDNQAHQLFLNGGYNFTKSTRGTFKMEYGQATQDQTFALPGTAAQTAQRGGVDNLNAKVVTKLLQVGVNSRLTQAFTLNANLRYYDKDDQTPTAPNYYTSGADIHYHFGQSMRTLSGKVEGIYRFADVYTLVAGLDEKRQKRELPMVGDTGVLRNVRTSYRDKLNETTGRLELRRSLTDTVNGSVSWVHAKRDGSAYTSQLTANQAFVLANPFNIADRTRNKARLSVDWTPAEAVNLQFVMEDGKDKYSGENLYGMEEGKNRLYSLDASWAINDKLSVNAWYSYDENKARQTGQLGNNTGTQYRYDLKDNANSLGLGVKWEATSALRFGSNLEWMRSASQYGINAWNATTLAAVNPAAGQSYDVPDINNKHLRLSVFATYALNKASTLRFDVIYDKWKTNDWTWVGSDGVSPMYFDATTGVAMRPNQSATFVGVRYIHKFQ